VDYNPQWFWVWGNSDFPTPFSVIKKIMRRNTVAINNVLKKKNYKTKFLISLILKKSTNIILKNKKIK
jgi:uncharacterized protein YdaT